MKQAIKAAVKGAVRPAVRRTVRWLVPVVSSRPWLVGLASRMFARMPSLKHRLRHMVSAPVQAPPPPEVRALTAAEAGVLADLQDAFARRGSSRS